MITGVNHVTVVVADLDRSLDFWRDALGLSLRAQSSKMAYLEGGTLYVLDPDGHKLELHLGDLASRLAHYRKTRPEKLILF